MGSIKALSLAGAIAFGAAGSAMAADLLPPAPPVEAPIMAPADFGGWYLRGDVGVGANQMTDWRSTLQPNSLGLLPDGPVWAGYRGLGDSTIIDAGLGYQFNSWFRADVTGEYRSQANYRATQWYICNSCTPPFGGDAYAANLSSFVLMANGYVDLGTWYGITPYVGAGIGWAHHMMAGLTDHSIGLAAGGLAQDSTNDKFAWAAMAGFGINITNNLKLDLGYRYLNMGTVRSNPIACSDAVTCFSEQHTFKLASHDFRLGFRYMFGEPTAGPVIAANAPIFAPRPGPLVRKY